LWLYIPGMARGTLKTPVPALERWSLKSFIPNVAQATGLSPLALYERQRALVRSGLLQGKSGRGPGSGVRATAETVALLLVAVLATDSLSETEERTERFAQLESAEGICPLTGKKTFAEALSAILVSGAPVDRVSEVSVHRQGRSAHILYFKKKNQFPINPKRSVFFTGVKQVPFDLGAYLIRPRPPLDVVANLSGRTLQSIAKDLNAVTAEVTQEPS